MENPLLQYINSNAAVSNAQVKKYAIYSIINNEVHFSSDGDTTNPILRDVFMEKCRSDAGNSPEKKRRLEELQTQVLAQLRDPVVQQEIRERKQQLGGKGGTACLFSESKQLEEEEEGQSKVIRTVSPPKQ